MHFEVVDDKNRILMNTDSLSCIPDKETIDNMSKSGYKFKLDGKFLNKKKLQELLKYSEECISE